MMIELATCVDKQIYVHMKIPIHNESEKSAMTDSKARKQVNQGKEEKGQQEAHFNNWISDYNKIKMITSRFCYISGLFE